MSLPEIRALTRRYIYALLAVAALAAIGQAVIQLSLSSQAADGRVVNLAGRQRMLSQRLAKHALAGAAELGPGTRAEAAGRLADDLRTWTRAQKGLRQGDAELGLPGDNSETVSGLLRAIQPDADQLRAAAEAALASLRAGRPPEATVLRRLLAAEAAYLPEMDAVVFQYDAESRAAVRSVRIAEGVIFALTLLVLAFEGVFVFHPVVERTRRAVDRLREANAALAEARARSDAAERAKDAILANMSHEMRTPLTSILGYADLLRYETDGAHEDIIMPIESGGRRLLSALEAVLDVARLEGGSDPAATGGSAADVSDVASGVVALLQPAADLKRLTMTLEAPPVAPVFGDSDGLHRALANVLHNAVTYTEKGSIRVVVRADADHTEVAVIDTGLGIAPSFLPRAFEAFEQESMGHARTHEGVGLGLSVTAQLVRTMGGEVSATSTPGDGTTITIRLATAPEIALPRPLAPAAEEGGPPEAGKPDAAWVARGPAFSRRRRLDEVEAR